MGNGRERSQRETFMEEKEQLHYPELIDALKEDALQFFLGRFLKRTRSQLVLSYHILFSWRSCGFSCFIWVLKVNLSLVARFCLFNENLHVLGLVPNIDKLSFLLPHQFKQSLLAEQILVLVKLNSLKPISQQLIRSYRGDKNSCERFFMPESMKTKFLSIIIKFSPRILTHQVK